MAEERKRRIKKGGLIVGLAATAFLAVVESVGGLDDFELWLLDKRFIHCNKLPPSDKIVHIDITDDAIERVAAWPWPRRYHADVIQALNALGAKFVVFDIEFSEPKPPRPPDVTDDAEVIHRNAFIDDDMELFAAIADAGNVVLPVSFRILEEGEAAAGEHAVPADVEDLRKRMSAALEDDFSLSRSAVAERVGEPVPRVDAYLAGVKRDMARKMAAAHFVTQTCEETVTAAAEEFFAGQTWIASLQAGADTDTAAEPFNELDRKDLQRAYRRALSERLVQCRCEPLEPGDPYIPPSVGINPPWYTFAQAAHAFGFVAFDADQDGVVRRIPLYTQQRGYRIPQLGYAVARELLGDDDPWRNVPTDDNGRAIIVWPTAPKTWNAPENNFRHIHIGRVLEIPTKQRLITENEAILADNWLAFVDAFAPEAAADYAKLFRNRAMLLKAGLKDRAAAIDAEIAAIREQARTAFAEQEADADANVPVLFKKLASGERDAEIDAEIARLAAQIAEREAELEPLISDKVCVIGYTATAVADTKPTAIYPSLAPGVVVHSAVINQTLADRWIRPMVRWESVALVIVAGVGITFVTAIAGPYISLAVMVGVQILMGLINGYVLFAMFGVWMAAATPMITIAAVWAAVTMYRQLTEERKKRQFASALTQYVSGAVAKRIADDIFDLAPVAGEVTCFFSDLKGFTSISERLGPAGTRDLLNPYLGYMSEVLQKHNALINKFMGDGIFAFFNPPILPVENHAAAACHAALDCEKALESLKRDLAGEHEEAAHLAMRVGISTGHVFVGDYGSASKRDYTCIGDTVNLAARLEPANKAFATRIMVAETTQRLVEDQFEFRYLGGLQVVGKKQAVGVYELLGVKDGVPEPTREVASVFSSAVEAFQLSHWDEAADRMQTYLKQRPDDAGAQRYLKLIEAYRKEGPPPDWNGAIVLTEK